MKTQDLIINLQAIKIKEENKKLISEVCERLADLQNKLNKKYTDKEIYKNFKSRLKNKNNLLYLLFFKLCDIAENTNSKRVKFQSDLKKINKRWKIVFTLEELR